MEALTWTIFLLGCILILAHTVETLLGFGSTLIALSLGVHLLPLETLVPVLVSLGLLQSIWLVGRCFRHIDWTVLLLTILPLAAIGMVVGLFSREIASENTLKSVLGGFILIVSLAELANLFIKKTPGGQLSRYFSIPLLIGGGIFHGLFATGGPPIVYFASRQLRTPQTFRATLSMLWLVLNTGLVITFLAGGQMDLAKAGMAAMVLPGFAIGILLGSLIQVKEIWFKGLTYLLLLFSGLFLIVKV
jgi:uncharacterized membrane protein YfcA